jgi:hypothetical protein
MSSWRELASYAAGNDVKPVLKTCQLPIEFQIKGDV